MATALFGFSRVAGADTPYGWLVPFLAMFGVGVGFTFQPVVVAVQSAVRPWEIGVATSSVAFFRQTGGTVGTAAFLSLLFAQLPGEVDRAVQDAVRADPGLAPRLQPLDGVGSDLSDSSFVQQLPDAVAQPFRAGFAGSVDLVLLVVAGVVAVGAAVFLFLPQLTLSTESGIQARRSAARAAGSLPPAASAPSIPAPQGARGRPPVVPGLATRQDRKSTRLNSSHANISYAVFCLKKKKNKIY